MIEVKNAVKMAFEVFNELYESKKFWRGTAKCQNRFLLIVEEVIHDIVQVCIIQCAAKFF